MTGTIESIERGSKGGQDVAPYWVAYRNWRTGEMSYTLVCVCGLEKEIRPEADGRVKHKHKAACCGWEVEGHLEGWEKLRETKREKLARLAAEEKEREEAGAAKVPLPRG